MGTLKLVILCFFWTLISPFLHGMMEHIMMYGKGTILTKENVLNIVKNDLRKPSDPPITTKKSYSYPEQRNFFPYERKDRNYYKNFASYKGCKYGFENYYRPWSRNYEEENKRMNNAIDNDMDFLLKRIGRKRPRFKSSVACPIVLPHPFFLADFVHTFLSLHH